MQTSSRYGLTAALAAAIALGACTGSTGPQGAPGTNGTNGTNGTACTVVSTGTGATVTCGTDSVQIANGTNGSNGTNGTNGTSCTMATNADGSKTISCGSQSVTFSPTTVDFAALTTLQKADSNLNVILTGFSVDATSGAGTVTFKVNDRYGNGVRKLWRNDSTTTTLNTSIRLGLLVLVPNVNGSANDTWVSYNAAPPTGTAPNLVYSTGSAETAGTSATSKPVVDNGDGTYAYTFYRNVGQSLVATYDATKLHRFVLILSATGNPIAPVSVVRDFQPSLGITDTSKDGSADVFDPASCLECHGQFRATAVVPPAASPLLGAGFHGGARYDPRSCVACHNDQRRFATYATTDAAGVTIGSAAIPASGTWLGNLGLVQSEAFINMPVFIHKIHQGENLGLIGGPYTAVDPRDVTYPQDIRNCAKCHKTVALKDNWKNKPSRRACGACHDTAWFGAVAAKPAYMTAHVGGAYADDTLCTACHSASYIQGKHQPIAAASGTTPALVAGAGVVPTGASVITYEVSSVSTTTDTTVTPNVLRPRIVFKIKKDGTAVSFGTFNATTNPELITGADPAKPTFKGSPTAYFVWSTPQDGITAPADFNASSSLSVRTCWSTGSNCTLTSDASGNYTMIITNAVVPASAVNLTGGLGYTGPMVQTDVPGFPYDFVAGTGGLAIAPANVWKAATGYTARRAVVDSAKCNACHSPLGVSPTFHGGGRNDAPTCSFCHNPNRTSSGWSADASTFIHAIHGGGKRSVPFTWQAVSPTDTFAGVTYPGILNLCTQCHVAGGYDFSIAAVQAAVPNMLPSTVATGVFNSSPTTNPTGYFQISPYVKGDNVTNYGWGYSTSNVTRALPDGRSGTQVIGGATVNCTPAAPCTCTAANPCTQTVGTSYAYYNTTSTVVKSDGTGTPTCTDASPCTCVTSPATGAKTSCTATFATCSTTAPCEAQGTTLVKSPIVSACSACHDTEAAISHMRTNGGTFYEPRTVYATRTEQCLICHGPGTAGDISMAHMGI